MPTTPSRNGPGRLSDAAYVTSVRGGRLPMGEHPAEYGCVPAHRARRGVSLILFERLADARC